MPEIQNFFFNDVAYASTSYTSLWIDVSSTKAFTFSVYCSSDCDIKIQGAVDDAYQIVSSQNSAFLAGSSFSVTQNTGLAFVRLFIDNIAVVPCDLKIQGFFYLDTR